MSSLWSLAAKHVQQINLEIKQQDFVVISEEIKRNMAHTNQPMHEPPPHISVAYNTAKTNTLEAIEAANGAIKVDLKLPTHRIGASMHAIFL